MHFNYIFAKQASLHSPRVSFQMGPFEEQQWQSVVSQCGQLASAPAAPTSTNLHHVFNEVWSSDRFVNVYRISIRNQEQDCRCIIFIFNHKP